MSEAGQDMSVYPKNQEQLFRGTDPLERIPSALGALLIEAENGFTYESSECSPLRGISTVIQDAVKTGVICSSPGGAGFQAVEQLAGVLPLVDEKVMSRLGGIEMHQPDLFVASHDALGRAFESLCAPGQVLAVLLEKYGISFSLSALASKGPMGYICKIRSQKIGTVGIAGLANAFLTWEPQVWAAVYRPPGSMNVNKVPDGIRVYKSPETLERAAGNHPMLSGACAQRDPQVFSPKFNEFTFRFRYNQY